MKTGLVTLEDKDGFVVMHELVQECVRHELTREAFSQVCCAIASVTYSKLIRSPERSICEILSSNNAHLQVVILDNDRSLS